MRGPRPLLAALGFLGLGLFLSSPASAAEPFRGATRIDQLQPASPESPFFRAEGPHVPAAEGVEFAAGVTFEYGKGLLKEVGVDKAGNAHTLATLVDNAVLARVSASITPIHWLMLDVAIPFDLVETGDKGEIWGGRTAAAASGPGVGDLRVGIHFRPVDTRSFNFLFGGRFWAPFGSQAAYLSDHQFRAEADLAFSGEGDKSLWGATLNVAPGFFAQRDGDRINVAGAFHFKPNETVSLGLEPSVELVTHKNSSGDSQIGVLVEPLVGLRLRFGGFRMGVGAGPGFGGGMGNAQVRALLSFAYVGLGKPPVPPPPPPSDRDLDKIPDELDACPDEAGPASNDPKLNGCPSHDRDGDGIRDDEDFCPDKAGIPYPDPKANGCPDTDNDGLPDPIDECKTEPGPAPTGCPKFARLAGSGGFKIEPAIEFLREDKLNLSGRAALEEVAATMRANPSLEKLTIGVGTKGAKPALSDKRAQALLVILRGTNLDSARYEVLLKDDLKSGSVSVRVGGK